jgi:proline iminopeptidase
MLEVGQGNLVYWEMVGNPEGKPAVLVHGGPGSGCSARMRQGFDPSRYRAVLFDQRGCGRSTPHASDPTTDLRSNTTHHLIADMELLREHLGIDRWLVTGGSWGSTLALAYAERFPERITEIVLLAVTTTRRSEIDWLYHGVARFFPDEWERFRAGAIGAKQAGELVAAYARLMNDPDLAIRQSAARAWCAWEDAVVSLEPNATPGMYSDRPDDAMLAFVRICSHYFSHGAWLEEGALLRDADRLSGIPGVLIHGQQDLSCPIDTAWELARAWPDSQLITLKQSGNGASDEKRARLLAALDRFA